MQLRYTHTTERAVFCLIAGSVRQKVGKFRCGDQSCFIGAQAFELLLSLRFGDAEWELEFDEKFKAADGATAMLELLAAQPNCVAAINKPGHNWVPWGDAELSDSTGPALACVAAFTNNHQVGRRFHCIIY